MSLLEKYPTPDTLPYLRKLPVTMTEGPCSLQAPGSLSTNHRQYRHQNHQLSLHRAPPFQGLNRTKGTLSPRARVHTSSKRMSLGI